MAKAYYDVWVKASRVEDQDSDLKDVIILKGKDNNPIYYTTVDADQVEFKDSDD